MNYLTLDVGTTACKCQLFSSLGEILFYTVEEYQLLEREGERYVDIEGIVRRVFSMMREAAEVAPYVSVCISSFGESFVLLDGEDNLLSYPMLYTDLRGEEETRDLEKTIGNERMFAVTGTVPNAMYSISKLLWLKKHRPAVYAKGNKLLLICDYLGYLLTGERVIDYSLAARTGVFDIRKKQFADDILQVLDVSASLFSRPLPAGSVVGELKAEVKAAIGITESCKLVLGSHDQVCATIGAGIIVGGEAADGMGTVECITAVFDRYCVVPFLSDRYCTYMFNYTSNTVVNWFRRDILHGYKGNEREQFSYLEGSLPARTDVLLLPYFAGCATPYQDGKAKGAFVNLTKDTSDLELYRAILEGTCFEMRVNLQTTAPFGISVKEIVATGGGANSAPWLQIKSDILGLKIKTLRSSEGGLCGCAMLSATALGACKNLHEAREIFVCYKDEYVPQEGSAAIYEQKYTKYKKLYHLLKEVF